MTGGLAKKLLESIKPPSWDIFTEASKAHKGIFGLLLGATFGLIKSGQLLDEKAWEKTTWDPELCFTTLYNAVQGEDNLNEKVLDHKIVEPIWLLGYYLNKSEQNLTAALDYCVNEWVFWYLSDRYHDTLQKQKGDIRDQIYRSWIGTRLYLLGTFITAENPTPLKDCPTHRIRDLRSRLSDYSCPANMLKRFEALHGAIKERISSENRTIEKALETLDANTGLGATDSDCLSLVSARINIWKHDPGFGRRTVYAVEWPIVAKALRWVAEFWLIMVKSTIKSQKTIPNPENSS